MKNQLRLIAFACLAAGLAACQEPGGDPAQTAAEPPSTSTSSSTPAPSVLFDDNLSKNACEVLTPELVAQTFGVPADALRQMKIVGCRYSWESEQETLEAAMSMLSVHDSEAAAAGWFANATKSRTAEEMQAELDQVAERLNESEQLDTDQKKSVAKNLVKSMGAKGIHFEDVAGVGDEARVSDDGTVYVRVNNFTFMVSAYKGAKSPPLDLTGVDLKQMAEVAKQAAAEWATETAPQRKSDGERLARAITGVL